MAATVNPVALFLRRNAFSSVCVALSLVLGGGSLYFWRQGQVLEARLQQRTIEGEEMFALLAAGPRLREQYAVVQEAVTRIEANLVVEPNLAENLGDFYRLEQSTGARLSELRQLNAAPPEEDAAYKAVPYSLQLDGDFAQVATYLFHLETGPRLARLQTLTLQRRAGNGADGGAPPPPPGGAGAHDAAPDKVNLALNLVLLGRP